MGMVWPVTALYMGPLTVRLYRRSLLVLEKEPLTPEMEEAGERMKSKPPTMFQNSIAVFHCGAGCTIGDVIAESIVPGLGLIFAGTLGSKIILDILGIAFQYFTIALMRGLPLGKALVAAARRYGFHYTV